MCDSSNASAADDDDGPETEASQDERQSETGAESSGSEEHDHLSMPQGEGGRADAGNDTEEEADNGPDEMSAATSKKPKNRNRDKWVLLKEWDTAVTDAEQIQVEMVRIVKDINIAAGLDKFPAHKDRKDGLHVLLYNTSWTAKRGLVTKDLYECPLKGRCKCKCQVLVSRSLPQIQLFIKSRHDAASHANDNSRGLTYQQRKTIEQAVRTAPLQSARAVARNMTNLSPSKHVSPKHYKAVGRVVQAVRAEMTKLNCAGCRWTAPMKA